MNKKNIKNVAIIIGIIFILIQFIRPSINNPPIEPAKDFITVEKAPENIKVMLKNSCYDCHTFETAYPLYNQIVPVSWYLSSHINEGRKHFNMSTWADFPENRKNRRLKGAAKLVRSGQMPLWDYKLMHPVSRLTEQEKTELADWFEKQSNNYPVSKTQNGNPEGGPPRND